MRRLLDFIASPRSAKPSGIAILGVVALLPAAAMGILLVSFDLARPTMAVRDWRYYLADSLAFGPLVESAFMFPLLWVLEKCSLRGERLAIASALFWALVHTLRVPVLGILSAWPFWIFSKLVIRWKPVSKSRALLSAAAAHAIFNLGMIAWQVAFLQ